MKKLGSLLLLLLVFLLPLASVSGLKSEPAQTGVIVSTPQADGGIYHQVVDGDTLFGIAEAYGMTTSEIMVLNGNSPEAIEIYIGDFLLIRQGTIATATLEPTATIAPYTPQPTLLEPTRTSIPSKTPLPSSTPTPPPTNTQLIFGDSQRIGLTLAGVSLVGIILVVIFGFLKKSE
jgi:LysM repeat protein